MAVTRRVWIAGTGAAALAAGAGLSWWRQSRQAGADPALASLWSLRFPRPEGGELAMASLRGRPLLINFWATWCAPCLREMPVLDRFQQAHAARGWQVLGLAIDGPTPVREYLQRVRVGFPIGLAGLDGTDLVRQLGNAQGGLPFSVLVSADGRIVARRMGELSEAELALWATRA
jgi:thiol-disulfide isomerase/thioredoxin